MSTARWRTARLATKEAVNAFLRDTPCRVCPDTITKDVHWLSTFLTAPERRLEIWTLRDHVRDLGYFPFFVHPSQVECRIGPRAVAKWQVSRLDAEGAPVLVREIRGSEARRHLRTLFADVAGSLGPGEVVFLQCVREGSTLHELLSGDREIRRYFHVVPYGLANPHRLARLPESYEAYLALLGAKTRADLRRTRRRLAAKMPERLSTRRFVTPEDVVPFVDDAMSVSAKTWQYRAQQSGLRNREALVARYATTAARGWFRSYILYAGEAPIAFQVGHVYGDAFVAEEIGYDPSWRKLQVGIFLYTEIVRDLMQDDERPEWFDFGPTDNGHKRRLGTDAYNEGCYYLLPRTVRGTIFATALRTTIGLTEVARRMFRGLGVLDGIMGRRHRDARRRDGK